MHRCRLTVTVAFCLLFVTTITGQQSTGADDIFPQAVSGSSAQTSQPKPAAPAQPATPPRAEAENRVTVQGTVIAVDYEKRTVTVRGRLGQVVTLDIPPAVTGLEQVKVGDLVTTTYVDRVNVRVKPAGEPAVDRIVEPTVTQQPGAVPGATVSRQREATVTITAWDPKTRTVVFTGPQGTHLHANRIRVGWCRSVECPQAGRTGGHHVDRGHGDHGPARDDGGRRTNCRRGSRSASSTPRRKSGLRNPRGPPSRWGLPNSGSAATSGSQACIATSTAVG